MLKSATYCLLISDIKYYIEGNEPIHGKQLDSMNKWSDEFRQKTLKSNERVAFDVMGGDFNFDNLSPGLYHYICLAGHICFAQPRNNY